MLPKPIENVLALPMFTSGKYALWKPLDEISMWGTSYKGQTPPRRQPPQRNKGRYKRSGSQMPAPVSPTKRCRSSAQIMNSEDALDSLLTQPVYNLHGRLQSPWEMKNELGQVINQRISM